MGIYVNPGNEFFQECLNNEIYIDKSLVIKDLNRKLRSTGKLICASRPRRFGKSVNMGMMVAYYSKGCDSREMFDNLLIGKDETYREEYLRHLNKHNVIKFDLNNFFAKNNDKSIVMDKVQEAIIAELVEEFPNVDLSKETNLGSAILKIYAKTNETFIFLMDEYDIMIREKVRDSVLKTYLDFLQSLFKDNDLRPAFDMAYLTGILPIIKDRIQSKFNEFDEYSVLNTRFLAPYIGVTYNEAKSLCEKYGMDFDDCKHWYDGYMIDDVEIFATKSIVMSVLDRRCRSYWGNTGSYSAISEYIDLNFDGTYDEVLLMLAGKSVNVDVNSYMNTMTDFKSRHDVFTYLIHIGYLGYNRDEEKCYIPNYEISLQWRYAVNAAENFKPIAHRVEESKQLVEHTEAGDAEYIAESLNRAHEELCHPLKYNNEHAFQVAMAVAYIAAESHYYIVQEFPSGKGFADIALIPLTGDRPAIVIELKCNESAGLALDQIKDRRYDKAFKNYQGKVMFVGINYDKESKVHECEIEWCER